MGGRAPGAPPPRSANDNQHKQLTLHHKQLVILPLHASLVYGRKDLCDAKHDARVRNFVSKNPVLPQIIIPFSGGGSA